MTLSRTTGFLLVLAATTIGVISGACGTDGDEGPAGAQGAPGPQGPAGGSGTPGTGADGGITGLGGACTTPCHTFNGVVDQWRFSAHSHPQENEIGTGACGNCHALDGIQQRVANKALTTPDASAPVGVAQGHIGFKQANGTFGEISYAGASAIGRIHCTTCHDFNPTNDPHVTGKYTQGQAPLRVAGGQNDQVFIEKSPVGQVAVGTALSFKSANGCVFCHKSRKDVTAYINPTTNAITSPYWGPHEGPQADIYSGVGAYHLDGKTYGNSEHVTIANKCVTCHMAPVATNGNVPDHTMKPTVKTCTATAGCHSQYTGANFDILGGQTSVKKALFELQGLLNDRGLLTRGEAAPYGAIEADDLADGQFHLDKARPGQSVDGPTAGILYNYLVIARGKDMGTHNPRYTKQLLFDAIEKLTGAPPTSGLVRPQ